MPIFCDETCTSGSGRSVMSSPESSLWIENAASWPCATAQMMFFGPNAAWPPKNTFGLVDPKVLGSTFRMFHLRNSLPLVEVEAAFGLDPGECILLADRDQHIVAGDGLIRLAGGNQVAAALGVM